MIACAQFTITDLNDASNEIIVGTQTAATSSWTGVAAFPELKDGQQIVYWLPVASTSSSVTLNLTLPDGSATGPIPCFYSGATRLTTHYAAGNAIRLVYRVNASVSGTAYTGWWADANYDSGNTYDRIRLNNAVTAKTAITASRLIVGDDSGYFNLTAGSAFSVNHPVLYAASAISANSTGTNNYLAFPSINLRTTVGNSSWTATRTKTCYLAGTLAGEKFTVASSNWLTTEPSDTNMVYISLGFMYSTYQLYLYPEHPMFRMINGVLTAVSQIAYEAKQEIDNLEVGGRNYALQSGVDIESDAYRICDYLVATPLEAGEEYTVSMCLSPFQDVERIGIYLSSGNARQCMMPVDGSPRQVISATFTACYFAGRTPDDNPIYAKINVYRFPSPVTGESGATTIHWIKIEKGNRATDYTPAPEDSEEAMELKLAAVHAQISTEAESIRSEVQASYALSSDMNQIRGQVGTLAEQTQDNYTWSVTRINQLQEDLETAQEATEAQLSVLRTYMTFGEDGLVIGKAGNPFTFRVVNDRLAFFMNNTEVAYLSNNKLYVTQAEILTKMIIGKFAFEPQANGNLSLIYTG